MKNGIINIWKQLAAVILGLLGFSSCDIEIGGGMVMYGSPHSDFKAQGTVSDENGKPIEGIRVAIRQHRHYENSADVIYDQNDWYENERKTAENTHLPKLLRKSLAPRKATIAGMVELSRSRPMSR